MAAHTAIVGSTTWSVFPITPNMQMELIDYEFTAGPGAFGAGSQVTLVIPAGWTAPTLTAGTGAPPNKVWGAISITSRTCTAPVTGTSDLAISGSGPWTITIDAQCAAGQTFILRYGNGSGYLVQAPAAGGDYEFTTETKGPGGTLTPIASQPVLTVTKAAQTITFPALSGVRLDQAAPVPAATASSLLAVTYSTASSACSVTSGGVITLLHAGTCTIDADQDGNGTYNAAPQVSRSFTVAIGNQAITFGALSDKTYGDADFTLSASASSLLDVTFASLTTSVCTVSGSTVTIVAVGPCTIRATQPGDLDWNAAAPVDQGFDIGKADTVTVVTCAPGPFPYTGIAQTPCTAQATGPGGLDEPVTVDYLANTDAGTASASADYPGDANYNPSSDSTTFDIGKADTVTVVTCAPGPFPYTGIAQTPCTAQATGPGGLDEPVTVDYLANTDAGTASASADYPGDANYNPSSDSTTFDIGKADTVTVVTCAPGPFPYTGIAQTPCTAQATGPGGLDEPVTVDYLANTDAGTASASADYPGDANYNPSSDSTTFDIGKADTVTVVTCAPGPFPYTGIAQTPCTAQATGPGGLDEPVTVDYLANTDAGTASASADYPGDANYNPSSDSTTFDIGKADAACTVDGWSGTYDGAAHGASGTCTGVGDEVLAGLDLGSWFTDVPGGTADWTFSNPNYNAASGSVDITIGQADAVCTVTGWSGPYDGAAHGATGSCTGVHPVVPTDAGIAAAPPVTLAGLDLGASFTDVPGGTATWTFTDVTGNYKGATGSVQIEITKVASTTVVSCPASVVYDGSAQTPCTVAVTGLNLDLGPDPAYTDNTDAGTATASYAFAGDTNHTGSSDSQDFTIDQATPVCAITGWSGSYDGAAHGASGTCTGVGDEVLAGLDLGSPLHRRPGRHRHLDLHRRHRQLHRRRGLGRHRNREDRPVDRLPAPARRDHHHAHHRAGRGRGHRLRLAHARDLHRRRFHRHAAGPRHLHHRGHHGRRCQPRRGHPRGPQLQRQEPSRHDDGRHEPHAPPHRPADPPGARWPAGAEPVAPPRRCRP